MKEHVPWRNLDWFPLARNSLAHLLYIATQLLLFFTYVLKSEMEKQ